MQETFDAVIASYQRCRLAGDFFEAFYKRFLSKAPEIPAMFARTDFRRQKRMLKQSLFEMLSLYRGIEASQKEVEKLAERHRHMNVTSTHYDLWLEALIESVAEFDPQFNQVLSDQWRSAMLPGLNIMRDATEPSSTPLDNPK